MSSIFRKFARRNIPHRGRARIRQENSQLMAEAKRKVKPVKQYIKPEDITKGDK